MYHYLSDYLDIIQSTLWQIWLSIVQKLATYLDSKKILSFLNQCGISSIDEDNQIIFISVPNEFVKTQVNKFFITEIDNCIAEVHSPHYKAQLVVDPWFVTGVDIKKIVELKEPKIEEKTTTKTKKQVYEQHTDTLTQYFGVLFDKKYQFSNFIVWANNEFAYSIMNNIIDHLGTAHNPFFLHGNVWLGKTHLLQATANQIISNHPDKVVVYLPTSRLVTQIIESIKKNTVSKLLSKFDEVDVLMLDDVQSISGKDACQNILFGLFNDFVDKNKQIILSSDRPPKNLTLIEERLKTRFALGTICEVMMPDFETRAAILSSKWESRWETISEDMLALIADTITTNVRELEWITNTLITKKQLLGKQLTIEDVQQVLKSMWYDIKKHFDNTSVDPEGKSTSERDRRSDYIDIDKIVWEVCAYYNITTEDIKWESRKKHITVARQMAMYLIKKNLWWTLERIWERFDKDHSSVLYAIDKFDQLLKNDRNVGYDYTKIIWLIW